MLVDFLDNHCLQVNLRDKEASKEKGEEPSALAFDFVYLPIDFKSGLNKGYAFVNFTKPQAAWKFLLTASNMKWDLFQSHKIREVVSARLQGKEKLEQHFETMNFPCECEDVLPVCFSPPRDGVIKGNQRTVGKLLRRKHV
uniref:Protein terminal ear1 n=1 Tax=Cajanus cajan TaxID=3821 RepID=A0A151RIU9_CAJCA|nr:Protein terminal ear1 [Cajanus cajan]